MRRPFELDLQQALSAAEFVQRSADSNQPIGLDPVSTRHMAEAYLRLLDYQRLVNQSAPVATPEEPAKVTPPLPLLVAGSDKGIRVALVAMTARPDYPKRRLVTFELTYPRWMHSEVMTHAALSKSSASSRAIPTERVIEGVETNPYVPEFRRRVTGMGVGDLLTGKEQAQAEIDWLAARDAAVCSAKALLHTDKSRVNRLLEPYMWHTNIVTGTEWRNFFGLRCPDGEPTEEFPAQLEFQRLAVLMRDLYITAVNERLHSTSGLHLPYVHDSEIGDDFIANAMISAGRLGRVSYGNQDRAEPLQTSIERAKKFVKDGHWSPLAHQGKASGIEQYSWSANFRGFYQARKSFRSEGDALTRRNVKWSASIS